MAVTPWRCARLLPLPPGGGVKAASSFRTPRQRASWLSERVARWAHSGVARSSLVTEPLLNSPWLLAPPARFSAAALHSTLERQGRHAAALARRASGRRWPEIRRSCTGSPASGRMEVGKLGRSDNLAGPAEIVTHSAVPCRI